MLEDLKYNILDFIDDVRDRIEDAPLMYVSVAVAVVSVILCGVMLLGRSKTVAAAEAQLQEYNQQITQLNSELSALSGENDVAQNPEGVVVALRSAKSAGQAVAALQNEYQNLIVGAEAMEVVEAKMKKQAESLDVYFDLDDKNARVSWFDVTSSTNTTRLRWDFMTNYMFSGDTVECLWLCKDSKEKLVAFATGTYTGDTGLFSDVHWYATAYGNDNYRGVDNPVMTYTTGPGDGSEVLADPNNVSLPDGYHFNEAGDLVNENGELWLDNEGWASEFNDAFKNSKEYREWMLKKQAEEGGN